MSMHTVVVSCSELLFRSDFVVVSALTCPPQASSAVSASQWPRALWKECVGPATMQQSGSMG